MCCQIVRALCLRRDFNTCWGSLSLCVATHANTATWLKVQLPMLTLSTLLSPLLRQSTPRHGRRAHAALLHSYGSRAHRPQRLTTCFAMSSETRVARAACACRRGGAAAAAGACDAEDERQQVLHAEQRRLCSGDCGNRLSRLRQCCQEQVERLLSGKRCQPRRLGIAAVANNLRSCRTSILWRKE